MSDLLRGLRRPAALLALFFVLAAPMAAARDRDTPRDILRERQERDRQRADRTDLFLSQQQDTQRLQRLPVTICDSGLAGTYPCNNVDLMAFMPLSEIGGGSGNDIWGWTDPMTGREYALMGRSSGTSFIDITDAANPVYLGNLPTHTSSSSWRDIKVHADHAYIVSEAFGHGMQVFDLTQLRNVTTPPVTFSNTAHYDDFGNAHNIVINEDTGYAYAVGSGTCSGGLHFVDLASPAAPVFAGCHVETVYTHDAQCVLYNGPDLDYTGREICINSNENRIAVVDVTDHSTPVVISTTNYTGSGYTHQGWFTEDQLYYLQGDELDEQNLGHATRTRIFDMADLDNPVLINAFDGPTNAIDHNLYTLNGYVYQANYRAGLQIYDLADIATGTLTEVGRFDIYPSSDSASFNGAWGVYPYFNSGLVVVSGIEQGLFVLRPALGPDFVVDAAPLTLDVCSPNTEAVSIDLNARNGYTGNVTLGTTNLPPGAVATFSVNPVAVPGSSTMTFDPGTLMAGAYNFQIEADDGSLLRTVGAQLTLADMVPPTPLPDLPLDGTIDVNRTPQLSWIAAAQAVTYDLELATESLFTNVIYSTTVNSPSHSVGLPLGPLTTYYWRVTANNACGTSTVSAVFSFTTEDIPELLVVDDDDNSPDVVASYTDTLDAMGLSYDVWDTGNSDDEPSAVALGPYRKVLWFTGDEYGGAAGPGGGGESALADWLDSSACLLIASQDYFYDRSLTGFMQSHLGLSGASSDTGQTTAAGTGTLFGTLGTYTLSYPYSNWSDDLTPDATAEGAFLGSTTNLAGIDKDSGVYRTTYLGFGIETFPTQADRETVLGTFFGWCDELPGLDPDADGATNETDCAPGDPTAWELPGETSGLLMTTAAIDNVAWLPPVSPGATAVTYDLLRGDGAAGFDTATCVVSEESAATATESAIPVPGAGYFYLIRTRNACGETLGAGRAQTGATCN